MNHSNHRSLDSRSQHVSLLLGLGSLCCASACAADYPLGKAKQVENDLTASTPPARAAAGGDAALNGLLGAPELNLSAEARGVRLRRERRPPRPAGSI
jgi:hypothetical protein